MSFTRLTFAQSFATTAFNITIAQGEDWIRIGTLTRKNSGVPINLTGAVLKAQLRPSPTSAILFTTMSTSILNPTAGQIQLKLDRLTTATLTGKTGTWDLRVIVNNVTSYLFGGTFVVVPTTTR